MKSDVESEMMNTSSSGDNYYIYNVGWVTTSLVVSSLGGYHRASPYSQNGFIILMKGEK